MDDPLLLDQDIQPIDLPNHNINLINENYKLGFEAILKITMYSTGLILSLVFIPQFRKTKQFIDIWHDVLMVISLIFV